MNKSKIEDILSSNISYQPDTWSEIKTEFSLQQILDYIKEEKIRSQIDKLRNELNNGNKDYYDIHKKRLPAVTFSGIFDKKRTLSNLKKYNPIVVLDIDKVDTENINLVQSVLLLDKFVLAFWKSPSNKGFKGLVPLTYQLKELDDSGIDILHKSAFQKLSKYFIEKYQIEIDKSGSDITRLCFLSSDKDLIIKANFALFEINDNDIVIKKEKKNYSSTTLFSRNSNDALYNPANKNDPQHRKLISDIIRYLNTKKKSITYDYENWCKVAMAISSTFTFDIGLKYFRKLSIRDNDKYDETICTNFLINCYETRKGDITFSSIIYLANQQGYKTKYQT